jgi:transmembrane sensor
MDELIARSLSGEATDLERRQLERWLASSPDHQRTHGESRRVWSLVGEKAREVAPPPPLSGIVAEAERRRARARSRRLGGTVLRSSWARYGLAAAAAAILVLAAVARFGAPGGSRLSPLRSSTSGSVVTMSLSDGSVVRLGAASRLGFPASRSRREVSLDGKAFFAVATGAAPFVVRTAAGRVTVHGTRFEVSTVADETRVVVVEGTVVVDGGGGHAAVPAGHVAWVSPTNPPRVVARDDVWPLLDWAGGILIFEATPLRQVAAEIGRRFHVDVSVSGSDLAARRVTAWFEDEPLEEVVSSVCMVAGVRCVVSDRGVIMGR